MKFPKIPCAGYNATALVLSEGAAVRSRDPVYTSGTLRLAKARVHGPGRAARPREP